MCAARSGWGFPPQPMPPDDAPAAGAGAQPGPGSAVLPSLGLGLRGGGREGARGRGVGRREQSLRQPQPQRRWDPVARAPPPRPGFAPGHASSLRPASILTATAFKALLLLIKIPPQPVLPISPWSRTVKSTGSNPQICLSVTSQFCLPLLIVQSLFQQPFHMFQSFPRAWLVGDLPLILFTQLRPDLMVLYFATLWPIASVSRIVASAWQHSNLESVQLSAFSMPVPRQLNTAGENYSTSQICATINSWSPASTRPSVLTHNPTMHSRTAFSLMLCNSHF